MLYFLAEALGFVLTVWIIVWAAEWLVIIYESRLIAISGAAFVCMVLSVIMDFTLACSEEGYDRSLQAIIERSITGGLIAAIVAYFVVRKAPPGKDK